MCRLNRLLFLALSCLSWLLLAPAVTWSAEVLAEPKSSADTTPQPSPGLPSETLPTASSQSLTEAWRLLKAELIEQGLDSEKLLQQLEASQIEIEEARRLSIGLTARLSSLESSIQTERSGAEVAIRTALEREAAALREAEFWRGVGIVGIVGAAVSLGVEFGPDIVQWIIDRVKN